MSSTIFAVGAVAVFLVLLRDGWKSAPFFAFILLLMVVYQYATEFIGLRGGNYYYGNLPLSICLAAGGEAGGVCPIPDRCIPLPVLLMEAAILLTVMRTTDLLGVNRLGKPLLDALMAVNIDVMLDPIVSAAAWCGTGVGASYGGLGFWTWLTTPEMEGLFFGVPLFNFFAWFADNLAFVIGVRLVAHQFAAVRSGKLAGFLGALGAIVLIMLIEGAVFLPLKWILDRDPGSVWQWTVTLTVFGMATAVVLPFLRGLKHDNPVRWPLLAAPTFYFTFGLGALLFSPSLRGQSMLFVVWLVCFAIGALYAVSPYWALRSSNRNRGGSA
jgi:uncharacterized membrane protein